MRKARETSPAEPPTGDSSSIAPDEPQELDPGVSATDAADEEALSAVKSVWCHASTRARKRIGAFVIKATVEQRGEAGEIGGPIVQPAK
jgi:hypothetical protein